MFANANEIETFWNNQNTLIKFEDLRTLFASEPVAFIPLKNNKFSSRIKFGVVFSNYLDTPLIVSKSLIFEMENVYGAINFEYDQKSSPKIELILFENGLKKKQTFICSNCFEKTVYSFELELLNNNLTLYSEDKNSFGVLMKFNLQTSQNYFKPVAFSLNFVNYGLDVFNTCRLTPSVSFMMMGVFQSQNLEYLWDNCTLFDNNEIKKNSCCSNNIEISCLNDHELFSATCILVLKRGI